MSNPTSKTVMDEVSEAYDYQLTKAHGTGHYEGCWKDHWPCVVDKLLSEIGRLRHLLSANDTTTSYKCAECGSFHLRVIEAAADRPASETSPFQFGNGLGARVGKKFSFSFPTEQEAERAFRKAAELFGLETSPEKTEARHWPGCLTHSGGQCSCNYEEPPEKTFAQSTYPPASVDETAKDRQTEKTPAPIRDMVEASLRNGPAAHDPALAQAMDPPPYIDGSSGKAGGSHGTD